MLLELVLPRVCALCRRPGADLCDACLRALPRLRPPLCELCGAQTAWPVRRCRECSGRRLAFASARAAVAYDSAVRALVTAWKERGLRRLARAAAELVAEIVPRPVADALAFVPPDGLRLLERGHHPAAALTRVLGDCWELPVEPFLERRGVAVRQRGLTTLERRRNVREAFGLRARPPPRVVLVDDIYTTGATVSEAAAVLRRAGAERVDVVTLARAVRLR